MNVVDSLVVTLGLDSKNFEKGTKDSTVALGKFKGDVESKGKDIAVATKNIANGFEESKKQLVALLAAFTAGAGVQSFLQALTNSDAALQRNAKLIGMSAKELSAWQTAAKMTGGNADSITSDMKNLSQAFMDLEKLGHNDFLRMISAGLGVNLFKEGTNQPREMTEWLDEIADKLKAMKPQEALWWGKKSGLSEDMVMMLMRGGKALKAFREESEKFAPTGDDIDSAIKRMGEIALLGIAFQDVGRKIATSFQPIFDKAFEVLLKFGEWASTHQDIMRTAFEVIAGAIALFSAKLLAIPFMPFISMAGSAASILGTILGAINPVVLAVGALTIALSGFTWNDFVNGGKAAFEDLKLVLQDYLQSAGDVFALVVALFVGNSKDIKDAWDQLIVDLSATGARWVSIINESAPTIVDAIKRAFNTAFDWLEERFHQVWDAITGHTASANSTSFNETMSGIQKGVETAKKAAEAFGGSAKEFVGNTGAQSDLEKLMVMGWTKEQAAGIVSNIQAESSGNHQAVGDSGKAYGLAQWHKDRQDNFKAWAGKDIRDASHDEQLAFINHELRTTFKAAGQRLTQATDARSAGEIVSRFYEIPKDAEGEAAKRGRSALDYVSQKPSPMATLSALNTRPSVSNSSMAATTNNNQSETHIGAINVSTQATDPQGVAKALKETLSGPFAIGIQANYGLTG